MDQINPEAGEAFVNAVGQETPQGEVFGPKLGEAVEFFEKMLETMPGDRTSLEFLSVAYEQMGQKGFFLNYKVN